MGTFVQESDMTELNDSTLSQLPPKWRRRPTTAAGSSAASRISAWAISIARIRPSTSTAVSPCPAKRIGASSASVCSAVSGAGRRPRSSAHRIACIRSPSRRRRATPDVRVIGAQLDYLLAPEQPDEVLALLTSPDLRIVTLTITEGGYHVDPDIGRIRHRPPRRGPRPRRRRRAAHGVRLRHRGLGAATRGRDQAVHRGVV